MNRFLATILFLLILTGTVYGTSADDTYFYDDWVQSTCYPGLCGGYYQEVTPPFPNQTKAILDNQPIKITSDTGEFIRPGPSIFQGHVHLIQGNRQLYTDKAIIYSHPLHPKIEKIQALGSVRMLEPGIRLDGNFAFFSVEKDTLSVENAHFRFYKRHARGSANKITFYKKNELCLENASYTTCAPFQNTWYLNAKRVVLNKMTGWGEAYSAKMYVKDIPLFYLPYVNFPIDDRRKTGFLYPNFDITNQSGIEFATPFYWNIASNYDATLTPRYLSKRGMELGALFRFLQPYTSGEIQGYILPNDNAYKQFKQHHHHNHPNYVNTDPRVTGLNTSNTRKSFKAKQTATFNPHVAANINYQVVSDDNYFIDLGNSIAAADTTQLLQQAELLYQSDHWKGLARIQQYQTLHPFNGPNTSPPYQKHPQIAFQSFYPDLSMNTAFSLRGDFSRFLHPLDSFTGQAFTTGERYYIRPSLSFSIIHPAYFIKPRLQFYVLTYSLKLGPTANPNQTTHPNLILPIFDIDSGLFFERDLKIGSSSYIQTLEPRLYYLVVPYRNQNTLPNFDTNQSLLDFNQLFRDNRFNGLDRLGDANQITLALTTRFLEFPTGKEKAFLGIGQMIYFKPQKVTDFYPEPEVTPSSVFPRKKSLSPFFGLIRYHLVANWKLLASLEWDPYQKSSEKETLTLQYRPEELTILNIGYQFLRRNPANINPLTGHPKRLEQTDISGAITLSAQWRILGRWHYDIHHRVTNDVLLGLEQDGCCTALRFAITRYLLPNNNIQRKYNNRFHIQFIFKGLGGVGHNTMGEAFSRAIPGYIWHESDF